MRGERGAEVGVEGGVEGEGVEGWPCEDARRRGRERGGGRGYLARRQCRVHAQDTRLAIWLPASRCHTAEQAHAKGGGGVS